MLFRLAAAMLSYLLAAIRTSFFFYFSFLRTMESPNSVAIKEVDWF